MKAEPYDAHGENLLELPLVGAPRATLPHEVQWLCKKASNAPGNILEIGVFQGATTLELATYNRTKKVYALDLPKEEIPKYWPHMTHETVGALARHLPNVHMIFEGRRFVFKPEQNIGFVFIDGDHSWEGCRFDTERAFNYFRPSGRYEDYTNARPGIVAWHDYARWPGDFGMQVYQYLNELSCRWPIVHVVGTTLCYCDL